VSDQFINIVEIFWIHLFILAILLNSLIDPEPNQAAQHPPITLSSYGQDSILYHLPKR